MLAHTEPLTGRHARGGMNADPASLPVGQPMPSAAAGRPRRPAAAGDGSPDGLRRNTAARRRRHGSKRWLTRRRLLGASGFAAGALALACLVTGSTFGLFSASATGGHNSFTAGTVTLANGAVANCPVSNLLPGSAPGACSFTATYSGPAAAYLAANVLIETQAGAGGTRLYNPADPANDLQVTVTSSSPSVTYAVPASATTCPAGAPAGSSCYELDNELVSTSAVTGAAVTFSVSVSLPTNSATGYQGGTAQVILTTHAVQSKNNTLSCSAAPAAGSPCTPSGTFAWS
jgi:predicted ribosomally synthesized peptide with SipW-like signal peptide